MIRHFMILSLVTGISGIAMADATNILINNMGNIHAEAVALDNAGISGRLAAGDGKVCVHVGKMKGFAINAEELMDADTQYREFLGETKVAAVRAARNMTDFLAVSCGDDLAYSSDITPYKKVSFRSVIHDLRILLEQFSG